MKKILVCDDDFIMLKLIENILELDKFEVFTANDGGKALELLQTMEFDLMITDMHMPNATGLELIDFVRNEMKSSMKIIVLTKDTSENTTVDAYNVGADDYVLKPVNMNVLAIKVRKFLNS
jgi:DNA-binding response OmpR family regulator